MAKRNGGIIGPANTPTSSVAAGVWRLRDAFNSTKNGTWPLTKSVATNSLRFNSGSSDYLSRTTWGTPTDAKIFTLSLWVKRSTLSARNSLVGSYDGVSTSSFLFSFESNDTLYIQLGGASDYILQTTQVFRDPSAWYHIVYVVDSTQATSSNRQKLYVNGTQVTSFGTANYTTLNSTTKLFNNSNRNNIGAEWQISGFLNGYLSEFYFIDGQALTPSSFGASNASGVWYPIPYQGTYGTNGFYLKFANSASLGTDSSGNANNFTVNNLTSVDQTTDTELNNFCLHNPLDKTSEGNFVLTEGNTKGTGTTGTQISKSTFYLTQGKWYWECKPTTIPSEFQIGVAQQNYTAGTGDRRTYVSTGQKSNNTKTSYGLSYTTNDIIGVALDLDNGTIGFYKNGVSQGTAYSDLLSGVTLTGWTPLSLGDEGAVFSVNFGNPSYSANSYTDAAGYGNFSYAVPSGYYALCTKNLNTYG